MWLPLLADEERRGGALDGGDATEGLGVAWGELVPDAPDVLPGFEADAVEEGELEVVKMAVRPAVGDVDHVAGFDPLGTTDAGDEVVLPVAPAHGIVGEHLVGGGAEFGLEGERVMEGVGGCAKGVWDAFEGVAVDAVGVEGGEFAGESFGVGGAFLRCRGAGALIPEHDGEENADVVLVEVVDQLADACDAAGKIVDEVVLVAVVDADVGIGGPEEDAVDAAVALVEIVEVAVDGVAPGGGIVEEAVVDHHLRLNEAALCPLELRPGVLAGIEADADAALHAPVLHVFEPDGAFGGRAGGGCVMRVPLGDGAAGGAGEELADWLRAEGVLRP